MLPDTISCYKIAFTILSLYSHFNIGALRYKTAESDGGINLFLHFDIEALQGFESHNVLISASDQHRLVDGRPESGPANQVPSLQA